jgi:eukaryotic-like serine/threonine-protein kinase
VDVDLGGPEQPPVRTPKVAGTTFGKYALVCKLATGGMGELFVARKAGAGGFEKLVVIKRLLPHLAEDAHFVAMLLDEARVAARLSHPNVCQVYDLGEADGHYYITMEHLEGVPASIILRRASRAGERLDLGLATAILRQTAAGLDHAHDLCDNDGNSVGLVHRDVSPSNLFVTAAGVVKVLDFGVAKSQDALARTHTGALKGKYAYMSPEQVLGNPVDRRSDVWSLGIVLFELLTAQRLFWRDSEYKMFQAIVDEPIPSLVDRRPGLPPRVAQVAHRALSRDPDRRFDTAREMGEALEDAMSSSGGIWRSTRISDYVGMHFGSLMQERRDEVQAGLSGAARRSSTGQPIADLVEDTEADVADEAAADGADELLVDPTADHKRAPAGPRPWLGAVALAVALGGGGVFAYQQWVTPSGRQPLPVVVLNGEVVGPDGVVRRAPARPAPSGSSTEPATSAAEPSEPSPSTGAAGEARPRAPAAPARAGKADADPYSAAVGRRQDDFRLCFSETATSVTGTPAISLVLHIDTSGRVDDAHLEPGALEPTELGQCVLSVARQVEFGRQSEGLRVNIPLRVRRR